MHENQYQTLTEHWVLIKYRNPTVRLSVLYLDAINYYLKKFIKHSVPNFPSLSIFKNCMSLWIHECVYMCGHIKYICARWEPNMVLFSGGVQNRLPLLGECSRNPSVIVCKLVLWEFAFGFSEFFWRLSKHLLISWWVIYECTCSQCTELSPVLDQTWPDLHILPNLSTWFCPEHFFLLLFPQMKKSSKENVFPLWKRRNKTLQKH